MKTDVMFVLVAKRTDTKVDMTNGRDYFLEEVAVIVIVQLTICYLYPIIIGYGRTIN